MSSRQFAGSPPRFVSLEQIMKAANGVSNMALAHEIAVDRDFKLETVEPPEDSLHCQVKQIVHGAFWDILREQLSEDPPTYEQAMVLLNEIKEDLVSLLLPHHTKIRTQIQEVLDVDLVRQQAENGTLDFNYYAQYIISVMAKLCAPVRDDQIRELMTMTDVVPMYQGIFKMLDNMKLDMANFTLQQMRPHIQQHSVEYEKVKFAEFLETVPDGLEHTREWLQRTMASMAESGESSTSLSPSSSPPSATESPGVGESSATHNATNSEGGQSDALKKKKVNAIITKAYMSVLTWDDSWSFPEALAMDQGRFLDLRNKINMAAMVGSVLLVTYNTVGDNIAGLSEFKEQLKEHVTLILGGDAASSDPNALLSAVKSVAAQIVKEVNECLKKHGFASLAIDKEEALVGQVEGLAETDNKVRTLVRRRVIEFIEQVFSSSTANPIRIPFGLSAMQPELARITGQFLRLAAHNRAVFGDYYVDLIEGKPTRTAKTPTSATAGTTTSLDGVKPQSTSPSEARG